MNRIGEGRLASPEVRRTVVSPGRGQNEVEAKSCDSDSDERELRGTSDRTRAIRHACILGSLRERLV
eukprot:5993478-Prymnesium_polylepis.1